MMFGSEVCSPFLSCKKKGHHVLVHPRTGLFDEKGFCWDPLACFVPCGFYVENPLVPLPRCIYSNPHARTEVYISPRPTAHNSRWGEIGGRPDLNASLCQLLWQPVRPCFPESTAQRVASLSVNRFLHGNTTSPERVGGLSDSHQLTLSDQMCCTKIKYFAAYAVSVDCRVLFLSW